jgi:hypothetical protein
VRELERAVNGASIAVLEECGEAVGFRLDVRVQPMDPSYGRVNARYGKSWKTKRKFLSEEAKAFGECIWRASREAHGLAWEGPVFSLMLFGMPRVFVAGSKGAHRFEITDVDAAVKATLDSLAQSPVGPEVPRPADYPLNARQKKSPPTRVRQRTNIIADDCQVVSLHVDKVPALEEPFIDVTLLATLKRSQVYRYALPVVVDRMEALARHWESQGL